MTLSCDVMSGRMLRVVSMIPFRENVGALEQAELSLEWCAA